MEYQDLQKTKVTDLREMAKEHAPEQTGLAGMIKEDLVDLLAEKMGIEKPTKKVASGLGKSAIKAEIRELKVKREDAREAGDKKKLMRYSKAIHRRKRKLRRMMQIG